MAVNLDLPSNVSTIVLGVKDIDASVAFYRDTLELKLMGQNGNLAFMKVGEFLTLMLNGELGKLFTPVACAVELVFSVESVTRTHTLLGERGCTFLKEPREITPGSWGATFVDPDMHMLTMMGPE